MKRVKTEVTMVSRGSRVFLYFFTTVYTYEVFVIFGKLFHVSYEIYYTLKEKE